MAFKVSPNQRLIPPKKRRSREEIFTLTVKAAVYWLLVQGAFQFLLTLRLAMWTTARYSPESFPVVKALGLTLLILGYYLYHSLNDPGRQKLLTDALLLYFLGSVMITLMSFRFSSVILLEKLAFLVNLVFCFMFFKYRPEGFKVALAAISWVPGLKKYAADPPPAKETSVLSGGDAKHE